MTRAQVLKRAAAAGIGVSGLALLAGCGSSGGGSATTSGGGGLPAAKDVTGSITLLNYPGWIAPKAIPNFEKKYPNAHIKQTAAGFESLAGVAEAVASNPIAYNVMLATTDQSEQLEAGGFVLPVDDESVPNLKNIDPRIRKIFPWGVAADTGAIGIGYRKDLVKEPVHTWADFWKLVPKYSEEVVMVDVDVDVLGSALIYLGKNGNSTNRSDLEEARDAVIELKPHVLAFKVTNIAQTLLEGSAALTMGYNYETAVAALENPNVVFVAPPEGVIGWVEGFIGLSKAGNPDTVKAFLNSYAEPKTLAEHTEATTAGGVSQAAAKYTNKKFLSPAFELPANATIEKFLGAEGVKLYSEIWSEVKAA
ncbi:MAG: extracellular solute-binding protein [Actinobacteria bacterium]|nr:extracellular solute-binding protein [Actinomycetota bacterium]